MTRSLALVLATLQRPAANLLARRAIAIAAASVAGMTTALSLVLALDVA